MGAERRRKPGWLWPKKVHNKGLKSEPFILEADQAARSRHEENSPEQVREGDLRVVGVRSLKWCRQKNEHLLWWLSGRGRLWLTSQGGLETAFPKD